MVIMISSTVFTIVVAYWVVRLAVRHALEDAHRRRVAEEDMAVEDGSPHAG